MTLKMAPKPGCLRWLALSVFDHCKHLVTLNVGGHYHCHVPAAIQW